MVQTVSIAFPDHFLRRRVLLTLLLLTMLYLSMSAQTVTEVITDYNGYWKSGQSAVNAVKPDNSHNMLAFTFNGTRYSTGVNDALLTSKGHVFTAGDYKALPVYQISGSSTSNTKIGLGAMYDGVHNGPGNPRPQNNINKYLSDGEKGLNLGTCVANLPAGEIMFAVTDMQVQLIGDGIPDLLITQVADPSGSSLDRYEFADMHGNRVGNTVDINLSNLPVLGNWTVDFYEVSSTPMPLTSGFTQTDRAIRLWAADFSAFGINAANIGQVVYFRIRLNGNSDVAFVAYNNKTFNLGSTLAINPRGGNNSNENPAAIQAYPNPVCKKLVVKHPRATGQEQITIRNIQGAVLMQQKPAARSVQSSFDVQQLAAGTYFLVVFNGKEQYTEILLKQ